jgi:hypothetical protein
LVSHAPFPVPVNDYRTNYIYNQIYVVSQALFYKKALLCLRLVSKGDFQGNFLKKIKKIQKKIDISGR